MDTIRRNHILSLFGSLYERLRLSIFPLTLFLISIKSKLDPNIIILILIGVLIFYILFTILSWKNTYFYLTNNFIILKEGIISKKTREIPYEKVQTININQSFFQRICNIAVIKIDTGHTSILNNKEELKIVLKKDDVTLLNDSIIRNKNIKADNSPSKVPDIQEHQDKITNHQKRPPEKLNYSISLTELIIMSLTSNFIFSGFLFLLALIGFGDDIEKLFPSFIKNNGKKIVENINVNSFTLWQIIIGIIFLFLIYLFFTIIASMIRNILKYHNFSIFKDGNNLLVQHGLLSKNSYLIPFDKINVVYYKQNLIRRLFGFYELSIESIGNTTQDKDTNGEKALLIPFAKLDKIENFINNYLPDNKILNNFTVPPKNSITNYLIPNFVFITIINITLIIFWEYGIFTLFLTPFVILFSYMHYKNSGISINDKMFCLKNGIINTQISTIRIESIQSFSKKVTPFQKRKGLMSLYVVIHGKSFGLTLGIKHISEDYSGIKTLEEKII